MEKIKMSNSVSLLTPVGRLVQGSLYRVSTTDAQGNLKVYKTGTNKGQPRSDYFFAIAIAKNGAHWETTEWGMKIKLAGTTAWPDGQYNVPTFKWKITDGDSAIPNQKGIAPCSKEGYPGHWVLNFSSTFQPTILNRDGTGIITEKDFINPGDYIQIAGTVSGNNATLNPGVYLNPSHVAFSAYGPRITSAFEVDPKTLGFGQSPLPQGASLTPVAAMTQVPGPAVATVVPPPYPQILQPQVAPPPAAASRKQLLPHVTDGTYESYIAAGWTDQTLIQHGKMAG